VNRSIHLVLDGSAVASYPTTGVGEVICETADEGHRFAVPVTALASGVARIGLDLVGVLMENKAFAPLELRVGHCRSVGRVMQFVENDITAAQAVVAAAGRTCAVLTARPERYEMFHDVLNVIAIT
jgi:hypothetical protein